MKKIKRAVFPVAGFGTRFLPATKSQPKEMLPIVDKPVIHYLVEEAVAAGIEEIIIITGRGKRAIEDYFDQSFELEYNLVEAGKTELLKEVIDIPNMAKFVYVRQPLPKGDGDAVLQAYNLLGDDPFLVLFGDDLVVNEEPATRQLIDDFHRHGCPVLGVIDVPAKEVDKYGIVSLEGDKISAIVEKPKIGTTPSTNAVIGKYVLNKEILEVLLKLSQLPEFANKELKLADAFDYYIKNNGDLYAKIIEGERYDTGSKIGLLKANVDFALMREDLGDEMREFLISRLS
jgi:UTP--glucose-1-phosphate uridylyltransferase